MRFGHLDEKKPFHDEIEATWEWLFCIMHFKPDSRIRGTSPSGVDTVCVNVRS
jgi:hypothetical protein